MYTIRDNLPEYLAEYLKVSEILSKLKKKIKKINNSTKTPNEIIFFKFEK